MMIEKLRKRQVEVETILWDGTDEAAADIQAWVGHRPVDVTRLGQPGPVIVPGERAFRLPEHGTDRLARAELYVAHNSSWSWLPVGYRVAKELDGSGFYPLSPDGAAAGYHLDDGPWHLDVPVVPEHVTAMEGRFTDGRLWLRVGAPKGFDDWGGSWWACQMRDGELGPVVHITDVTPYAPLVEHPDPRKATT